jgi:hypothetical protein
MAKPVFVCCSDVHLSHNAPVARSEEPNWYMAMSRTLSQLKNICGDRQLPLVIAGDIFDRWNSPPGLIYFAIEEFNKFSRVFTVPGQHDLPNHRYDERARSAYGVLEAAGSIVNLIHGVPYIFEPDGEVCLWGVPWGFKPPIVNQSHKFNVAIMHRMVWAATPPYPGAPEEGNAELIARELADAGFSSAISGDNHEHLNLRLARDKDYNIDIMNCGTLMRRHSNEVDYTPSAGLFFSDGHVESVRLDITEDMVRLPPVGGVVSEFDFSEYLDANQSLSHDSLDFRVIVNQMVSDVPDNVRVAVLECVDD